MDSTNWNFAIASDFKKFDIQDNTIPENMKRASISRQNRSINYHKGHAAH